MLALRNPQFLIALVGAALVGCACAKPWRIQGALTAARRRASASIRVRDVLIASGCALVVSVALLAVTPVEAVGVVDDKVAIVDVPSSPPSDLVPTEIDVEIRSLTDDPVSVTLPLSVQMAIARDLPGITIEGWSFDDATPARATSDHRGAVLGIEGLFTTLELAFASGPGAGTVEISVVGTGPLEVELAAAVVGVHPVRVESGTAYEIARTRFLWRPVELTFAHPVDGVERATVGGVDVEWSAATDETGQITAAHVGLIDAARSLGRAYWEIVVLAVVSLAIALTGVVVAQTVPTTGGRAIVGARGSAVGIAMMLLVVGALNYLLPVSQAVWALVPLVGVGTYRWTARTVGREAPRGDAPVSRSWAAVFTVVAAYSFWFVVSNRWAIGHLQTDVFDTFNLTTLFWHTGAAEASTDFGNGFRLLDYSGRSAVWGTLLSRPSDAIVVFRLLFAGLIAHLSFALFVRLGTATWLQHVGAVLVVLNAAFISLYAEGYMSREFFLSWVILSLLAVSHQLADGAYDRWAWFAVAAVLMVPLAIVPPYFVVGPALALVAVVTLFREDRSAWAARWRTALGGIAIAFVILGAPNLWWLRHSGDASRYIEALNLAARERVIPFYDSLRFPASLVGLVPFHIQDAHWLGGDPMRFGPLTWDPDRLAGSAVVAVVLAILTATVAVAGVVLWRRGPIAQPLVIWLWAGALAAYLFGLLVLRLIAWDDQTYFVLMWAWSLAPVGFTAIIIVYASAASTDHWIRHVAAACVVLLGAVNLWTVMVETSVWTESENGPSAPRWHFDLAGPLDRLARTLHDPGLDLGSTRFAVVERQPSSMTGTDDDRVLTNVAVNLLEASGFDCEPCARNPDVPVVSPQTTASADVAELRIGTIRCDDRPVLYEERLFVICGPP